MVTVVTATEFHARTDVADWRYALGRVEATYRCGSFDRATALASSIAAAAERAGHHPDLDVRYPDWLHVALTTHAVDAVTNLDVELAGEVAALAAAAGAEPEPHAVQALEVAIDAIDIDAVRRSYVLSRVLCRWSGRPVMGHSGEGRLLSGHDPAVVCGDGTACRSKDNPKVSGSSWASPVTAILFSAATPGTLRGRRNA